MSDFEIVKDFDRTTTPNSGLRSPAVDAVIAGEVVWLPNANQVSVAGRFHRAATNGYRITTRKGERDGVRGVYVWRIEREPKA